MHRRRLTHLLVILSLLALPASAAASPAPEARDPKEVTAHAHYASGIELYQRREYARALTEFEQAYALVPSPKLLFSLGQTHSGLRQYADAFLALRAYLDSVGSSVPTERRTQVERQLEALRELIGTLDITVNLAGATLSVDGEDVGRSPLPRPMVVDAGRHHISAGLAGYLPNNARVSVVAGKLTQVRFELQEESPPPEAGIAKPLWVVTGILAALTIGSGAITLVKKHDYEESLSQPHGGDPGDASRELQNERSRLDTWLIVTDVLAGATLVSGGTALYFSLRPSGDVAGDGTGAAAVLAGRF